MTLSEEAQPDSRALVRGRRTSCLRTTLVRRLLGAYVLSGVVLRAILLGAFRPERLEASSFPLLVICGAFTDFLVGLVVLAPFGMALWLSPDSLVRFPPLRILVLATAGSAVAYLGFVEYFFFDEFASRFNHIVLDYLIYPHEVFDNIWQSFAVVRTLVISVVAGLLFALPAACAAPGYDTQPSMSERAVACLYLSGWMIAAIATLAILPAAVSEDRLANEIGRNGLLGLVHAFRTATLDYRHFYKTIPTLEARQRAAAVLEHSAPSQAVLQASTFNVDNTVRPARKTRTPSQVVVVIEESLGSDFVGSLGAPAGGLTPELDRWASEGLLLTGLYANGNRTVRGLEGILCSFVPLPGDSIVKRARTDRVDSLAHAFGRSGYRSAFLYGGRGLFDNIEGFARATGYDELIEERDFPLDAFKTAWGVADEFAFDALLARQRAARSAGQKLFATLLTVSNHKPFFVPPGRLPLSVRAQDGTRAAAVRYADWALGRYLEQARSERLLDDAVVLIAGDHGARVYGSERIPLASYRVHALFLVPDPEWKGVRQPRLASQIDLAPTLLSLCGLELRVGFLGSDIAKRPRAGGRAFVNHNHELGLLTGDRLTVLGLRKTARTYERAPTNRLLPLMEEPGSIALERNAIAVFQTAEELYEAGSLLPAVAR